MLTRMNILTTLAAVMFLVLVNGEHERTRSRIPALSSRPANIKRCINVHELANGQVLCAYNGCRMRCAPRYHFIGTESSAKVTLTCDHNSGDLYFRGQLWTPHMTVCSPHCESTCQNGGTCSSPDRCTCLSGFTGKHCESEMMLGDSPYGGYQLAKVGSNQRRVECKEGTRMPDGSTSVTLTFRDSHYFYPDGRVLLGADQVICSEDNTGGSYKPLPKPSPPTRHPVISNKPKPTSRPLPLISPTVTYDFNRPSDLIRNKNNPNYQCSPACANGGTCVYTDTCSCPRGYWGPRCYTRICSYPRFESDLHASRGGTLHRMEFECHPGYQTAEGRNRVVVLCQEGYWKLPGGKPLVEDDVKCL